MKLNIGPAGKRCTNAGPSFCWQCSKQLHRAPGKGLGLFYFAVVVDRQNVEHRVHGDCVERAVSDGCRRKP